MGCSSPAISVSTTEKVPLAPDPSSLGFLCILESYPHQGPPCLRNIRAPRMSALVPFACFLIQSSSPQKRFCNCRSIACRSHSLVFLFGCCVGVRERVRYAPSSRLPPGRAALSPKREVVFVRTLSNSLTRSYHKKQVSSRCQFRKFLA